MQIVESDMQIHNAFTYSHYDVQPSLFCSFRVLLIREPFRRSRVGTNHPRIKPLLKCLHVYSSRYEFVSCTVPYTFRLLVLSLISTWFNQECLCYTGSDYLYCLCFLHGLTKSVYAIQVQVTCTIFDFYMV